MRHLSVLVNTLQYEKSKKLLLRLETSREFDNDNLLFLALIFRINLKHTKESEVELPFMRYRQFS